MLQRTYTPWSVHGCQTTVLQRTYTPARLVCAWLPVWDHQTVLADWVSGQLMDMRILFDAFVNVRKWVSELWPDVQVLLVAFVIVRKTCRFCLMYLRLSGIPDHGRTCSFCLLYWRLSGTRLPDNWWTCSFCLMYLWLSGNGFLDSGRMCRFCLLYVWLLVHSFAGFHGNVLFHVVALVTFVCTAQFLF